MIGWMASDYFRQSPVLFLPVLALVLFVTVFGLLSLRAMLKKRTEIEILAALPFDGTREEHER